MQIIVVSHGRSIHSQSTVNLPLTIVRQRHVKHDKKCNWLSAAMDLANANDFQWFNNSGSNSGL
jgi:hypothetical protein